MIHRAYGAAREEHECGMTMDAGMDNTGFDPKEHNPEGQETAAPNSADQTRSGFSESNTRDLAAPDMPDPNKFARDWVTLWQSELSAMATDREMHETWQTLTKLWANAMSSMLLPARGSEHNDTRPDNTPRAPRPDDAPRATPPAAAPDPRDAEIARLARDVAALQRRLADLERGGDPPVAPKPGPPRKPRR